PVRLIDTAGLRLAGESPADDAEALGIARSREALADADLVIVVLAATATADGEGILTSAITTQGMEELRSAILRLLQADGEIVSGGGLNSLRQQEAVGAALQSVAAAETANESGVPHEFLLADLHGALRALDSLTGQTTSDDILNRIFSTFCIGK